MCIFLGILLAAVYETGTFEVSVPSGDNGEETKVNRRVKHVIHDFFESDSGREEGRGKEKKEKRQEDQKEREERRTKREKKIRKRRKRE